jgi:hypothetical protein
MRPLRREGLATLALRKLNRQPSDVPVSLASLPLGAVRESFSEFVTLCHAPLVWQAPHALTSYGSVRAAWRGTRRQPRPGLSANSSTPCSRNRRTHL